MAKRKMRKQKVCIYMYIYIYIYIYNPINELNLLMNHTSELTTHATHELTLLNLLTISH